MEDDDDDVVELKVASCSTLVGHKTDGEFPPVDEPLQIEKHKKEKHAIRGCIYSLYYE